VSAVGGLSVLGVATLLTFGGIGHAGPDSGRGAPITLHAHHRAAPSSNDVVCSAATDHEIGRDRRGPNAGGLSPEHGTASGNLTVSVPRAVFIRAEGRKLVVTTNTGERPQGQDAFYYIAGGAAGPASAGLKFEVLSQCGARVRS